MKSFLISFAALFILLSPTFLVSSDSVTQTLSPAISFAQEGEVASGFVTCQGPDCNFCHVVEMVQRIIQFIITLAIVIATIILAYAGIKLVVAQGNPQALTEAKGYFFNVCIGILIILTAWTLVDTLMKVLIDGSLAGGEFGVWNEIDSCGGAKPVGDYETEITLQEHRVNFYSVEEIEYLEEIGIVHFDYTPTGNGSVSSNYSGGHPGVDGNYTGGSGACGLATSNEVVSVPGESSHKLLPQRVNDYVAMREAARRDGVTIRIKEAWRSDETQKTYWDKRGCQTNPANCSGRVAKPCGYGGNGSNHGRGLAVDIVGSVRGTTVYNWLKANGGRFGFYNNLPPRDPYHWSPSGR